MRTGDVAHALVGALLLLGGCAGQSAEQKAPSAIVTTDAVDPASVREDIVPNWNINYEAAEACPKPFQLQVALKPGGVVQDVTLNGEPSDDDACRQLVESARRAVLQSSPLPVPDDVTKLNINFDIPAVLEEL